MNIQAQIESKVNAVMNDRDMMKIITDSAVETLARKYSLPESVILEEIRIGNENMKSMVSKLALNGLAMMASTI